MEPSSDELLASSVTVSPGSAALGVALIAADGAVESQVPRWTVTDWSMASSWVDPSPLRTCHVVGPSPAYSQFLSAFSPNRASTVTASNSSLVSPRNAAPSVRLSRHTQSISLVVPP